MSDRRSALRRDGRGPQRPIPLVFSWCLAACLWPALAAGQIYRYQDDQGVWHFTDDPPARYSATVVPDISLSLKSSRETEPVEDLAARLQSTYNPATPIAYATLAVVSIKSDGIEGSGFFCSKEGHILTNKHLVLPDPNGAIEGQALTDREQELQTIEARLSETQRQLGLMKKDLEGYTTLIESGQDEQTLAWARDAKARLQQRYLADRSRIGDLKRRLQALEDGVRTARRQQGFKHGLGGGKRRFEIVLKDGTELTADLIEVSEQLDLALLKLGSYRTPFLGLGSSTPLSQGARVFAIGNPLGMQDAVTSGVVTRIASDYLLTDAEMLPGSSGGPLIRETGEVIGINVSRQVAQGTPVYAAGLGKAIPIIHAIEAFPTLLTARGTEVFTAPGGGYPSFSPAWTSENKNSGDIARERLQTPGYGSGFQRSSGEGPSSLHISDIDASSGPVRLILPEEDGGPSLDGSAAREARSLDFPPEGSGILPSGVSLQRE